MKYGYARVSTEKQSLLRQEDSLIAQGIDPENIFIDKITGTRIDRDGYERLKDALVKGDELYIHALDRLGRKKSIIKTEIAWMKENGIILRIMNMPTTMMDFPEGQEWVCEMINNIILEVLSTIAEQERDTLSRRTSEGMKAVMDRGVKVGRPQENEKYWIVQKAIDEGVSVRVACREVGIAVQTYYNCKKRMQEKGIDSPLE